MQHFLKQAPGSTRAGIFSAELFDQFLAAVHDANTAFHMGLGRETASAFAHGFKITPCL